MTPEDQTNLRQKIAHIQQGVAELKQKLGNHTNPNHDPDTVKNLLQYLKQNAGKKYETEN